MVGVLDLRSICLANGVGIFLLLYLLYASHARILRDRLEDRLYTIMVLGVMIGCFMEAFSYIIDGRVFPGARILNYAANTYLFTVNLLLPLSVLLFVGLRIDEDFHRVRRRFRFPIILGFLMVSLNIINWFTPIIYDISPENVYSREPASYLFYVVIFYYLMYVILVVRRDDKAKGTKSFFNIHVFVLPIVLGATLQFMFYGLSLAWLASAIGLVGLFMMQQNEMAYIDPLVVTYNRQYLDHIFSTWSNRGTAFSGVMIDIDRFKAINDTCGHSEGDRALKAVTDILKASRKENEWVFRFAGDEFIVLKMTQEENSLADYMDEVNRRVAEFNREGRPYVLSLSYGMSHYRSGDLDIFIKEMDSRMYAMKAEHHALEQSGDEQPPIE